MIEIVNKTLKEMTVEESISVLLAVESGSRAWGFGSPDSDFDIRFVYVHPRNFYLQLQKFPDTIDRKLDGDLDLMGWDLRKFLFHIGKGNPVVWEWLQSPIVYYEKKHFCSDVRAIADSYFSPSRAVHHYTGIARKGLEIIEKGTELKLKQYFYVIRPLFAAQWVVENVTTHHPPKLHLLIQQRCLVESPLRGHFGGENINYSQNTASPIR